MNNEQKKSVAGTVWTDSLKSARDRILAERNRAEKIFFTALQAMALTLVLLFMVQIAKTDYSLRQNEYDIHVGVIFADYDDSFWRDIEHEWRKTTATDTDITFSFRRAEQNDCSRVAVDLLTVPKESFLKIGNKQRIKLLILAAASDVNESAETENLCRRMGVIFFPLGKKSSVSAKKFAQDVISIVKDAAANNINRRERAS